MLSYVIDRAGGGGGSGQPMNPLDSRLISKG